jgi:hypothetical protein
MNKISTPKWSAKYDSELDQAMDMHQKLLKLLNNKNLTVEDVGLEYSEVVILMETSGLSEEQVEQFLCGVRKMYSLTNPQLPCLN